MSKEHKPSASDPEAEFLAEQSKLARRALGKVFGEMERNLVRSADIRAWAVRYPWPTVAAAAAAGVGAGVAVKSAIHPNGKTSNGAAATSAPQQISEVRAEADPEAGAKKESGKIASGLRWLAAGLATAAAEALFAATRQQLEAALKQPQEGNEDGSA